MRITIRRGSTALWASRNPVLAAGEPGYNTTTGETRVGDGAAAWSALPSMDGLQPIASGNWRPAPGFSPASSTHALNVERAQRLCLRKGQVLQAIAINVVTIGTAGAVVRLGVRLEENGLPGTLLADWGTVITDTSTGVTPLVIAYTVPNNNALWITATAQVASCVLTGVTVPSVDGQANTIIATPGGAYFQTGVSGALPGTFTIGGIITAATAFAVQGA